MARTARSCGGALGLWLTLVPGPALATTLPLRVGDTEATIGVTGSVEALGVIDTGGGPDQPPHGIAALRVDTTVRPWSAHVALRGMAGGPFRGAAADVFNLRHTFQNVSPSLDFPEAYLAWRGNRLELRAGIQRFAFGKLDGAPPTDVVNPRDFHDPLLRDFEEAKLGVPALSVSHFPDDWNAIDLTQLRLDAAYIPLAVPPRLPLTRERWFPPTTNLPSVPVDCAIVSDPDFPCAGTFTIPFDLATANDAAPATFSNGGIALRAAGSWPRVDWAAYHYSGPETAPNTRLEAELSLALTSPQPVTAAAVLVQDHATMHMTGFDLATVLGGATLRLEGAFFQDRHYLRPAADLVDDVLADPAAIDTIVRELQTHGRAAVPFGDLFVAADAIEWGIGIDYYFLGVLPLLQLNQTVVLDGAPRLLIGDPDTRLTGVVRTSWWHDRIELDLRSAYTFERESWLALPRVAYAITDSLRVRVGYLALGGSRHSLIGQYRRNDEVVIDARFSF